MAALGLMTALIAIHPFPPRLPSGILEVTALDCGQGDSLFLVLPDKTTMLVDASGSRNRSTSEGAFQGRLWDPGEDIVSPYLWSRGIKRIDIVVLSPSSRGPSWRPFCGRPELPDRRVLARTQILPRRLLGFAGEGAAKGHRWSGRWRGRRTGAWWRHGSRLVAGAVAAAVYFPSNDDSLVLRLTYHGASVLLPGDISTKVEQELLASGEPLESQVLKVAHHGSNSSSSPEFLARVNPRVAIVTVARATLETCPARKLWGGCESGGFGFSVRTWMERRRCNERRLPDGALLR